MRESRLSVDTGKSCNGGCSDALAVGELCWHGWMLRIQITFEGKMVHTYTEQAGWAGLSWFYNSVQKHWIQGFDPHFPRTWCIYTHLFHFRQSLFFLIIFVVRPNSTPIHTRLLRNLLVVLLVSSFVQWSLRRRDGRRWHGWASRHEFSYPLMWGPHPVKQPRKPVK